MVEMDLPIEEVEKINSSDPEVAKLLDSLKAYARASKEKQASILHRKMELEDRMDPHWRRNILIHIPYHHYKATTIDLWREQNYQVSELIRVIRQIIRIYERG
jgi:hypothetical protein